MGLPMYVSPSPSKRQLPSKQPTSQSYTPQPEESFEETYQNFRTSAYDVPDIPDHPEPEPQRTQRSRRSTSLPYNLVQQHIQRLHQLHHLHRTREQQMSSSNLASRRGLNSTHHLSLRQMQAQAQARRNNLVNDSIFDVRSMRDDRLDDSHDEIIDFSSFDDFVSSLDTNNNNNNNNNNNSSNNNNNYSGNNLSVNLIDGGYQRNLINNNNNNNNDNDNNNSSRNHSSSVALDNVIRRVNLLRQFSQQQESRVMRSSSRHHRSTGHSSSGRSSTSRTTSSQNAHFDRRRADLIQRGIDMSPSTIRHSSSILPEPTLLYPNDHSLTPLPPMRLSAWHTRRGANWSPTPQSQQRQERRSSFTDDFYSTEVPHSYEDDHHMSRILSPIPRRFATFASSFPIIRNDHELFSANDNNIDSNGSNVDRISNGNEPVRTEQRGSASGEVC